MGFGYFREENAPDPPRSAKCCGVLRLSVGAVLALFCPDASSSLARPALCWGIAWVELQKVFVPRVPKTLGGRALADMKTLAPGTKCHESTSAAFSHAAEKRQKRASPDCHTAARFLKAELDPPSG